MDSDSATETTKRQQSPAEASGANLDGYGDKVYMHVVVSITVLLTFSFSAARIWQDLGRWHDFIVDAVVFLYLGVMMNLLLIKRRNQKRREREACEWIIRARERTPMLMSVATGAMLFSLGVAIFILRPGWLDLAYVALSVSISTAMMFLLLKMAEDEEKKWATAKRQDASDLV